MPVFRVSQFTAKRRLARTESLLNAQCQWSVALVAECSQWLQNDQAQRLPNDLRGCRISVVAEFSQWPVAANVIAVKHCSVAPQ